MIIIIIMIKIKPVIEPAQTSNLFQLPAEECRIVAIGAVSRRFRSIEVIRRNNPSSVFQMFG